MELQGTVKKVFDLQTFASGFQKRDIVLLTQEQYPQPISVEFLQEKVHLLDNVTEGENVKVSINIRGREWTSPDGVVKYFNSITGWRLEKISENNAEPTQVSGSTQTTSATNNKTENPFAEDGDDDLPF